jgi:hypothetical protein
MRANKSISPFGSARNASLDFGSISAGIAISRPERHRKVQAGDRRDSRKEIIQ